MSAIPRCGWCASFRADCLRDDRLVFMPRSLSLAAFFASLIAIAETQVSGPNGGRQIDALGRLRSADVGAKRLTRYVDIDLANLIRLRARRGYDDRVRRIRRQRVRNRIDNVVCELQVFDMFSHGDRRVRSALPHQSRVWSARAHETLDEIGGHHEACDLCRWISDRVRARRCEPRDVSGSGRWLIDMERICAKHNRLTSHGGDHAPP